MFGPKLLATREPFPDPALESRCLTYRPRVLTGRDLPKDIPLTFPPEAEEAACRLRNKLLPLAVPDLGHDRRRSAGPDSRGGGAARVAGDRAPPRVCRG